MEKKIHVRIQTQKKPAIDVLREALKDLKAQNEAVRNLIKVSSH